jgi:cyclophilin family peptidyl-prolyl cis-trans isomerase
MRLGLMIVSMMFLVSLGPWSCGKKTEPQPAAETPAADTTAMTTASNRPLANVPPNDREQHYSAAPEMTIDETKRYIATIQTQKGNIVVELDAVAAPLHTNNFVFLARQGFFDGLTFHRVEPNFVIQGGDPLGVGTGGPGYRIPAEIGLPHHQGVIAMARQSDQINPERLSSGSQFYITLQATPFLDGQYSVFGRVIEGFEVVQQIARGDVMVRVDIEER